MSQIWLDMLWKEKTYKSCRYECENCSIYALGSGMSSWVEEGIQRHALEDIENPRDD